MIKNYLWGGKGLFQFTVSVLFEGKSGQEFKAGIEADITEEWPYWFAHLRCLACFFIHPRATRDGTIHRELGSPTSITN